MASAIILIWCIALTTVSITFSQYVHKESMLSPTNLTESQNLLSTMVPNEITIPSISFSAFVFTDLKITGLTRFESASTKIDMAEKHVYVEMNYQRLDAMGDYRLRYIPFVKPEPRPFELVLNDTTAKVVAVLKASENGNLQVEAVDTNMDFGGCDLILRRSDGSLDDGFVAGLFRQLVGVTCSSLSAVVKPLIADAVNGYLRAAINDRLNATFGRKESAARGSGPVPSDAFAAMARDQVLRHGLDPYHASLNRTVDVMIGRLLVTELTASGLSDVLRVDNVTAALRGDVLRVSAVLVTGPLNGTVAWSSKGLLGAMEHRTVFAADGALFRVAVNQTLGAAAAVDGRGAVLDAVHARLGPVHMYPGQMNWVLTATFEALSETFRDLADRKIADAIRLTASRVLRTVRLDEVIANLLSLQRP